MKKTRTTEDGAAAPFWASLGTSGSEQIAAANECASAMFRGFEAMRKVQERAAHEAARYHASAAERIKGGAAPADIVLVQAELMRHNMETATQYWQQLGATAMEMNTRMLNAWNGTIDAGSVLESLSAMTGRPH